MNRKINNVLILCAMAVFLIFPAAGVAADDFSFDDAFGDGKAASHGSALEVHGSISTELRGFPVADGDPVSANTSTDLDFAYTGESVDGVLDLDIEPDRLDENMENLIDEAYLRYYGSSYDFELGFMKVVWGKGDQIHVVDVLNSNDYTDFYNPDYIDRRIAVPMTKFNFYVGQQGKIEVAYVPTFTADNIPTYSRWAPQEARAAAELAKRYTGYLATQAYNAAGGGAQGNIAATNLLAEYSDGEELYPNTETLEYGQAAVRFTNSFSGIDLGAIYYFGYNKQPSIQPSYADPMDPASPVVNLEIDYDRQHIFGLEAGAAPAGFNLRAEAAYYMTDDFEGDDPVVHNHSIQYLAGFDRDLPLHNTNINIQAVGTYRLHNDEIENPYDVEYGEKDDATQTLITAKLSDSFNHDKVQPEVVGYYVIEEECWMVTPLITYSPVDDLEVEVSSGLFFGDQDTTFGQFDKNNFIELKGTVYF